jgi:hypothetical protein
MATLFVVGRILHAVRVTPGTKLGRRLDRHLRERVKRAMGRPIGITHLENPEMRNDVERAPGIVSGSTAGGVVKRPPWLLDCRKPHIAQRRATVTTSCGELARCAAVAARHSVAVRDRAKPLSTRRFLLHGAGATDHTKGEPACAASARSW